MGKAKPKTGSPFVGRWHIVSMAEFDEGFFNSEVQAFLAFNASGGGAFQFGCFRGDMDCRLTARDGQPAVEWSWAGYDEMDPEAGAGWATLQGEELHGIIGFDDGEETGFVARRADGPRRKKGK